MSRTAHARISPLYEVPDNLEDTVLLQPESAELKQGEKAFNGTLCIKQRWVPFVSFVEFSTHTPNEIQFGDAQVKSSSLQGNIKVANKESGGIEGFWIGGVELGSDHKLERVTFHLPNYPDLSGGQDYQETITEDERRISIRWSEIILEADGWRIVLQPYRDFVSLRNNAILRRTIALTGVGEIRRSDGKRFSKKMVKPLLETLRVFLSFALAEWMPPLFIVGSNKVASKSWQMWADYDVSTQWYSRGWLDERHGQHLAEAFPGFCKLWKKEGWQDPITEAVTWLIEASRRSGGTTGAIAFGQIPLEMLAWLVFADDNVVLEAEEFEKLNAANKLQLLLSHCGIPLTVPPALATLSKVATQAGKKMTGPRIATEIRNTIIHPHKKNRDKILGWKSKYSVEIEELHWNTYQLFIWYITLVLLYLMDYDGRYANRLTVRHLGAVEPVPWASTTK